MEIVLEIPFVDCPDLKGDEVAVWLNGGFLPDVFFREYIWKREAHESGILG